MRCFPGAAESGEGLSAYAITVSIPLIDLTQLRLFRRLV
jgi:hypothetical protein